MTDLRTEAADEEEVAAVMAVLSALAASNLRRTRPPVPRTVWGVPVDGRAVGPDQWWASGLTR